MGVGGAVTVVGSLLPWVRTGGARRHSYDLLALVARLGFAEDGPAETALRWWPLLPLLVVAAVVAVAWGWPRIGAAVGAAAALYAGGVALAVIRAPAAPTVEVELGAVVTIVGAAVLLAGAIAVAAVSMFSAPRRRRCRGCR